MYLPPTQIAEMHFRTTKLWLSPGVDWRTQG